ncbi:hypothetical protein D3C72_1831980 [compost metagenome]
MLQQHDGLAVADVPVRHHPQRLRQGQFQNFNIFAFVRQAAPVADAAGRVVFGDKEMQTLRHRTGTHEGFKDLVHLPHPVTSFLFHLGADALLRAGLFQQAGR